MADATENASRVDEASSGDGQEASSQPLGPHHYNLEQITLADRDFIHDGKFEEDRENHCLMVTSARLGNGRSLITADKCVFKRHILPILACFDRQWVPLSKFCAAVGMARQLVNYRILNCPDPVRILRFSGKPDLNLMKTYLPKAACFGSNAVNAIYLEYEDLDIVLRPRPSPVPPVSKGKGSKSGISRPRLQRYD